MKITAVDDKIVCKQLTKNVTKGGIIIPNEVKTEPQSYGKVMSFGENVKNIKEGDVIIYHQRGGMAVVLDNKLYAVVKYDEVYAVIEGKDILDQMTEVTLG
jgi:co-chaperonin GroES (HSP10)